MKHLLNGQLITGNGKDNNDAYHQGKSEVEVNIITFNLSDTSHDGWTRAGDTRYQLNIGKDKNCYVGLTAASGMEYGTFANGQYGEATSACSASYDSTTGNITVNAPLPGLQNSGFRGCSISGFYLVTEN